MRGINTKLFITALIKSLQVFLFRNQAGNLVIQNPNIMKSAKPLFASLTLILSVFFSDCTKDNTTTSTTEEALIRSNWAVDYYFNNQDLTSNYGSYRLLFSSTGLLAAQKDNETIMGNWSNSIDVNNNEVLDLSFNTSDANLIQLSHQWKLVNKTSTTIEFEETEHVNAQEVFRIRKQQ